VSEVTVATTKSLTILMYANTTKQSHIDTYLSIYRVWYNRKTDRYMYRQMCP